MVGLVFNMKKDGFVSTALIYTFFIIFLILMVFLLNNYSSTRFTLNRYVYDIEEELYELANADINLNVFVWSETDKEYKYVDGIPTNKSLNTSLSYCKNKSTMSYENGEITIKSKGKDYCYAYFN